MEVDDSRGARALQYGFLVATVLACAVALSPNNVDPDLWGHVQYAEDALAAGELHTTATHTFTAEGRRWINHENLSELALALGYRWLGPQGMLAAKCLLGLGVVWLMLRTALRQGVSLPVVCAWLLLVTTTLTAFWAMRPQLASFALLALLVVVLDHAFASWQDDRRARLRPLAVAPVLMIVWANAHGGFAAGLALLVAYLGLRSLEAIYYLGRRAAPQVAVFALAATVSGLATLVNPYGVGLHRWLIGAMSRPRPEIIEWLAPQPSDVFFLPMVLLYGLIPCCWIGTQKRRDWTQIVLIGLFLWQSLLHSRHIPLVAVLAGFWLPVHLQSLVDRFRKPASPEADSRLGRWSIGLGLACAMGLLVYKLDARLRDMPVPRDEYPVDAAQFMADHDLHGRLVVNFNWAQYALAALPNTQVAFDGRFRTCYPQEVIDMHFDFIYGDVPGRRYRSPHSGAVDGDRVLDHQAPDLVLIDREYRRPREIMQRRGDFVLLYQDGTAQLWGRRAVYDQPASPRYFAASQRRIGNTPRVGSVTWPALPTRSRGQLANRAAPTEPTTNLMQEDHRS